MKFFLLKLLADKTGATAIEYGLLTVIISIAGFATIQLLGGAVSDMFSTLSADLSGVTGGIELALNAQDLTQFGIVPIEDGCLELASERNIGSCEAASR